MVGSGTLALLAALYFSLASNAAFWAAFRATEAGQSASAWALGLGMILGGAMGNLVDRFFRSPGPLRGHVVDFLSIGWWPVFNVADPAVVGGAILLVVLSLFGYEFDSPGRRPAEFESA